MTAPRTGSRRLPSGRHGIPREVVVQTQRERILQGMVTVAAEKGYEATTVADVIERAQVSRTTFYELFKDKDDCFLAAYDGVIDELVQRVGRAYREQPGEWPRRIHFGLRALVQFMAAESDVARLAMVEITTAGPAARQRYRDALSRFTPFLDEGRGFSEHAPMLPATTSRLAIGGGAALLFDEIRAGRGAELERILPDLVFAVLMPFIGPEAAAAEMNEELD